MCFSYVPRWLDIDVLIVPIRTKINFTQLSFCVDSQQHIQSIVRARDMRTDGGDENNIKTGVREIRCEDADWINLV
jgi:hypothetical protein